MSVATIDENVTHLRFPVETPARIATRIREWGTTPRVWVWGGLVLACVGSRLATTISYIEDPDSLRFALSVADGYDLAALQPHFPGYPVFWALATLFYGATGHFSVSFSIVGGLATAGLVAGLLALWRKPLRSIAGGAVAAAVVFNPLVWLMGNRYMPDLLGTACAVAALAALLRALPGEDGRLNERAALLGVALTGVLAGLRLSYLPLVAVPVGWGLLRSSRPLRLGAVGVVSVAVWLVPMIVDTGWTTLVDVAWRQTTGHFTEFGGTVQTAPDVGRRLTGFVRGLWADGLGAWWPGRHPLTAVVGAGVLGLGGAGVWQLGTTEVRSRRRWGMLALCLVLYAVWVFFFQNVIHKSRHVLPLLPFVLLLLASGADALWRRGTWRQIAVGVVLIAYGGVTGVLVRQHLEPSAIAQAKAYVAEQAEEAHPTRVVSIPLVNTFLRNQQVGARYYSVDDERDRRRLHQADAGQTLVVGTYEGLFDRPPDRVRRFYHNPFVNRMWPDVTVYVYEH